MCYLQPQLVSFIQALSVGWKKEPIKTPDATSSSLSNNRQKSQCKPGSSLHITKGTNFPLRHGGWGGRSLPLSSLFPLLSKLHKEMWMSNHFRYQNMDLLESFGMQAIESAIQTDLNNEGNSQKSY